MALTRTIDQMVDAIRRATNTQGATAAQRHPDAELYDYANRGIAALDRILKLVDAGERYLSSTTLTTGNGQELYLLPSDFLHLVSLSGVINGRARYLTAYAENERPGFADQNAGWTGEPLRYRLRQGNISLLPVPAGSYVLTLWYAPAAPTLTSGQTYDTIARLDDYIVSYGSKELAKKDQNWNLHDRLVAELAQMKGEIEAIARNRDKNSPSRIVDTSSRDRFGRSRSWAR